MSLIERLVEEAIAQVPARGHRPVGVPDDAAALHLLEGDVLGGGQSRRGAGRRLGKPERAAALGRVGARGSASSILTEAYNEELGFFAQAYGGAPPRRVEPAAARRIGIIDPRDPRFVSTVRAYERCSSTAG